MHSLAKTEGMARGLRGEMNIKVNLLKPAEIVYGVFKILYKVKKMRKNGFRMLRAK